jgi:UDP-N-acetylmuramoyl-L-alanyl-D-glutamate--2,6-diaminopimelate ligase
MLALMRLAELAAGIPGAVIGAGGDAEIGRVVQDSRRAGPGDLFVAVPGLTVDGHSFALGAAENGAAVVLERPLALPAGCPFLLVPSTRRALAELAATLLHRPARRLKVAGVTGTDGKTTTTHMAAHILASAGRPAGAMSTVSFQLGEEVNHNESGQTTIEAPDLQQWLARMADAGLEQVVLEVTSHALVQERVGACDFDVVAVTYVGRDHLDYHASWEDYVEAKARLIDLCAAAAPKGITKTAVLNRDDASFDVFSRRRIERMWTYSIGSEADLVARNLRTGIGSEPGSTFLLSTPLGEAEVNLHQPARFNVHNALAAAGICLGLGLGVEAVASGLSSFRGVSGRLESVNLGQPYAVYVDFAHSAGALRSALAELRILTPGRLITVFGSTARSDHDRPGMGRAAAEGSDFFIITTDDPVNEDPAEIARQVAEGAEGRVAGRDFDIILDRRAAIRHAVERARPGDAILLAGKGHERSMLTARGREPWDERAEVESAIRASLDGQGGAGHKAAGGPG